MDLFNNKVGRDRPFFLLDGFSSVEERILDVLDKGLLKYLNNLHPTSIETTNSSLLIQANL